MQNDSGGRWVVGTIANGHVLTQRSGWVRLNPHANPAGPWRPGDEVNGHVFTGASWVPIPKGWRPDPGGRHQLRWWTGDSWGDVVETNGLRYNDPMRPVVVTSPPVYRQPRARSSFGAGAVFNWLALGVYGFFWFGVAVWSVGMAVQEKDPAYYALTSTASLNVFLFMLTGKTRGELRKGFIAAFKKYIGFVLCGAVAAGGVWLSLHFDDPDVLYLTAFVVMVGLMFSWVFTS